MAGQLFSPNSLRFHCIVLVEMILLYQVNITGNLAFYYDLNSLKVYVIAEPLESNHICSVNMIDLHYPFSF